MPGYLTDYTNNKVLDLLFGSNPLSPPATYYVGLSTNPANKAGLTAEPSGGAYSRVAVTNNPTNFPSASGGTKSNALQITFPTPTANWGAIQSLFLADAQTGGNVLAMADLTVAKTILSGNPPATIAVGALFLSHT